MTNEAFKQGFSALTATFPQMNFNGQLFWAMLNDLDGQFFLMSVWELIKNTKEIYPGTNIVAIIRSRANELKIETQKDSTLKLEAETEKERIERWRKESSPMPEECKAVLEKLGARIGQ